MRKVTYTLLLLFFLIIILIKTHKIYVNRVNLSPYITTSEWYIIVILIPMKGLAYVDFLDDEHLVAAVAKNKNTLLGKKLSIARSDPKRGGKETLDPRNAKHGK
jgi:hypothetical protein